VPDCAAEPRGPVECHGDGVGLLEPAARCATEKTPSPRRVADSVSASNGRVSRRASFFPAPAASTVTTAATATTSGALQLRRRDVQDQQPAADRGREQRRHREPTVVHVPTDPPGRRVGSDTPSSATRGAGGIVGAVVATTPPGRYRRGQLDGVRVDLCDPQLQLPTLMGGDVQQEGGLLDPALDTVERPGLEQPGHRDDHGVPRRRLTVASTSVTTAITRRRLTVPLRPPVRSADRRAGRW
jgi:hypothetical protein